MHTTIRANTQRWIALVLLISAFCLAAMPNGSQAQTGSVQAETASSKRVPMSHLYVTLSDAMAESKSGRDEQAKAHLIELKTHLMPFRIQPRAKRSKDKRSTKPSLKRSIIRNPSNCPRCPMLCMPLSKSKIRWTTAPNGKHSKSKWCRRMSS